jgi:hypothetical protein
MPAGTTAGQDLNLSLDRVNSNRNFTNKLWNAGKFILFQLDKVDDGEWARLAAADLSSSSSWQELCLSDRWILSSLHQVSGGLGQIAFICPGGGGGEDQGGTRLLTTTAAAAAAAAAGRGLSPYDWCIVSSLHKVGNWRRGVCSGVW